MADVGDSVMGGAGDSVDSVMAEADNNVMADSGVRSDEEYDEDAAGDSESNSDSASGSRAPQIDLADQLDKPVPVKVPRKVHASWSALFKYLEVYSLETNQALRCSNTVKGKLRNEEIAKTKAAKRGEAVRYIPVQDVLVEMIKRGENLTRKDVENMIYSFNTDMKKEDDETACLGVLSEFTSQNESNCASLDETSRHETGVISITSEFMGDMMLRFSEMVLVDCTHRTKKYKYQLMTLMIIDDNGEGQVVQHSLLERNADWHRVRALEHFERVNRDVAEKVQVIMVDKDLNDIKVLRMFFTRARIHICSFHVVKYLKEHVRKTTYGSISTGDRDTLVEWLRSMVHASTKAEYEELHATLHVMCEKIGFQKFFAYFQDNWDTYSMKPTMGMSETIRALIDDDLVRSQEYVTKRTRIGVYHNAFYDADMNQLLKFTKPFVAKSVQGEYALAQIETMGKLASLKSECEEVQKLTIWLRTGVPKLSFNGLPDEGADEIDSKFPNEQVPGVPCTYAAQYRTAKFLGIVEVQPRRRRGPKKCVPDDIKPRLQRAAADETTQLIIIPVNFTEYHWALILVKVQQQEVQFYDSLEEKAVLNTLEDLAHDLQSMMFDVHKKPFTRTKINNPRQWDGYSCGVFV
ncbi:hypothetical protein P43SY_006891 [Pythium insidiosum]|uniref:Ubiquitin-like protease family profile domain-containing protein n=1 Tax=Pythium insidiosum TaxID=114742 RepID=A0AAD5Q9T4_PYTIN|nr:hypothetical protein P43SY_006891 [Pythium insidiosum]